MLFGNIVIYIIWYIIHRSQSICLVKTIPSWNIVFETNLILAAQTLEEKREKDNRIYWYSISLYFIILYWIISSCISYLSKLLKCKKSLKNSPGAAGISSRDKDTLCLAADVLLLLFTELLPIWANKNALERDIEQYPKY